MQKFKQRIKESFSKLFTNIKMMITNPAIIIVTILFTTIMCFLLGKNAGLILGPLSIYQIMFHDKNHRWDGENWVDKDGIPWKDKKKEPKEPVL